MNWPTLEDNYNVTVTRIRDAIDGARRDAPPAVSHLRWFIMDAEPYPICGPRANPSDFFLSLIHISEPTRPY